ncbi:MAG: CHAP domain-containing protein [Candidatus Dormibacteria bacterium]
MPAPDRAAARLRLAQRARTYEARQQDLKAATRSAGRAASSPTGSRPLDERLTIARWLSHGALLLVVVLVPALGGLVGARPAAGHALGLPVAARADAAASAVSARGFIIKPAGLGQTAQSHREVITYTVQDGDVLGSIGERYGLRIDTLRQTNNLADVDRLSLGQQLLIPPTNGILVKVAKGDTVPSLAQQYHADAASIIGYNAVRNPALLVAGTFIMIPDGTGFTASQEAGAAPAQDAAGTTAPAATDEIAHGGSSYNHFPWGQCTYYVASRRNIPWNGNAWQWFGAAQASGMATGARPRPGAIMVTWESRYYGHVAVVEAVYGDGSYLISEMNYRGLGVVDQRHIIPGQVPLIGFIYD